MKCKDLNDIDIDCVYNILLPEDKCESAASRWMIHKT